jgi:hypothetical protein
MSGSPPCGPEASAADMCFVAVFVAHTQHTSLGSGRNKTVRTERIRAPCSPPNGSDVKLRGQGPRAEAGAAHGLPACESRDAGRAPPPSF